MSWTTPITYGTAVLASSTLNAQLRDNTNFLLSGKAVAEKMALLVADKTLTMPQATWTNIDHTNFIVTIPSTFSSGRVRVDVSFYAIVSGSNVTKGIFDISIDNTTYSGSGSINAGGLATATPLSCGLATISSDTTYVGSQTINQVTMSAVITGLSTGTTHTFEPMYTTVNGGSGVVKVLNTYHPFYIIAEEI